MSKVKHVNPYREGSNYHLGFEHIQKLQVITRSALVDFLSKKAKDKDGNKITDAAAIATATVLLSPREKNGRGDCRGNLSAKGEVYFVLPLKKEKGEERKFRLRWRVKELARRDYERPSVKATKSSKKSVKQEKHEVSTPVAPVAPVAPVEG